MKVLFVNHYYWPDVAATAQQLTDLAEFLAEAGHDVQVLCSAGTYSGQGAALPKHEVHRGVTIKRLPSIAPRGSISARLLGYMGFDLMCLAEVLRSGPRFDVIVTLTDPPLLGLMGSALGVRSFGRVKHVGWAMDLYPDTLFALGALSPASLSGKLLARLSRLELARSQATVVLGPCMRDRLLQRGANPQKLKVIGVWNSADELGGGKNTGAELRAEWGLEGKFVVMYSGNAGRAHDFEALKRAMAQLADHPDIHFLFVGGGPGLDQISAFVEERGISNFTRLPYVARERLGESLSVGDVHYVCLHPSMSGLVVPSKLYGIMGVARPVVFNGPRSSTVAQEILAAQAGVVLNPGDSRGLVQAILSLAGDRPRAEQLGRLGHEYFLRHHERIGCCAQWESLLREVSAA